MPRLRHTGTVFTTSPALVSYAELPATPTTELLPVVVKTYLRSDVEKHDLTACVHAERTALVRLSSDQSGLIVRLLSARATERALTFIMARAPGLPAAILPRPMPARRVARITSQLVSAMRRVHDSGIVHADLTLRNVIVDLSSADAVCLVDFSASFVKGQSPRDSSRTTCPHVLAPELLQGRLPDPTSDIWALGVFVWAMLFGGPGPLGNDSNPGVLRRLEEIATSGFDVIKAFRQACDDIGVNCSEDMLHARDFVAVCLSLDPLARFTKATHNGSAHVPWSDMIDYDRIKCQHFLAAPD